MKHWNLLEASWWHCIQRRPVKPVAPVCADCPIILNIGPLRVLIDVHQVQLGFVVRKGRPIPAHGWDRQPNSILTIPSQLILCMLTVVNNLVQCRRVRREPTLRKGGSTLWPRFRGDVTFIASLGMISRSRRCVDTKCVPANAATTHAALS